MIVIREGGKKELLCTAKKSCHRIFIDRERGVNNIQDENEKEIVLNDHQNLNQWRIKLQVILPCFPKRRKADVFNFFSAIACSVFCDVENM